MTRSSRHKSHKQSKHSSRDAREHSDSGEDLKVKDRKSKEESSVRDSRDSSSGGKRKLSSQSRDGKDLPNHGNGEAPEEYVATKRRKDRVDVSGSDRWNGGGGERGDNVIMDKEMKGESSRADSDKGSKSKVSNDSKSKPSRRHDSIGEKKEETSRRHESVSEKKEVNVSSVMDKEEKKSDRVESKRKQESDKPESDKQEKEKPDRESSRKEVNQYREAKERDRGLESDRKVHDGKRDKDKDTCESDKPEKEKPERDFNQKDAKEPERGPEKDRKGQDGKGDTDTRAVEGETKRKQRSQSVDIAEERKVKRGMENIENREPEKEHAKKIRKGDGSNDKDKYQDDIRNSDDRRLSSRGDRDKAERYKEERHRDDKDKYSDDLRDSGGRRLSSRGEREKGERYKEERHRDDKDKYHDDLRDGDDRRLSSRGERDKSERYKEERHKDGGYRDKYRDDIDRDNRHRDGKHREDTERDKRHRDEKYRDEHVSRDRPSDKSYPKHSRDESDVGESRHKKSRTENSNRDSSPVYDDRSIRCKDDKEKRRCDNKEDRNEPRSRDQRLDVEKKPMISSKAEPVTDRGRSHSRHDIDSTLSHNKRRISPSPSSHAAKEQYRYNKQPESKYRDSVPEDRVRQDVTSAREIVGHSGVPEKAYVSRPTEKNIQKDDNHTGELSAERRPNSDARTSPMQLVDNSPSSSSNDRRQLNRIGVRRNLDVDESGQKSSGGFKELKDYSGNGAKGSQAFPSEPEFSQPDGDNMSISSPFSRTNHFSGNHKSLLPPPSPFRSGIDSPSVYGSNEDDNRSKPSNRFKRMNDSNMGRAQINAWKGVPNWPSSVSNGFIPYQHGPPPVAYHPVMQQFTAPPMYGVRPSMDFNHARAAPYPISDADRFSGHGRPYTWRNPVDDSCPPLHGWDANNGGSHMYGRLDWDQNRTLMSGGGGGWETSVDLWKGQNGGVAMDSVPHNEENTIRAVEETSTGQSGQEAEQNQVHLEAENTNIINQSSNDALVKETSDAPETVPEKSQEVSEISGDDEAGFSHVYLSKLDISADLIHPELYNQCTGLMVMEQSTVADEDTANFVAVEGVIEARAKILNTSSTTKLFAAVNDSVFQRAMSLYKKQREEVMVILPPLLSNEEHIPSSTLENSSLILGSDKAPLPAPAPLPVPLLDPAPAPLPVPLLDPAPSSDEVNNQGIVVSAPDNQEAEVSLSIFTREKTEMPVPSDILDEKLDENLNEELISTSQVKMEVDKESRLLPSEEVAADAPVSANILESPKEEQDLSLEVKTEVVQSVIKSPSNNVEGGENQGSGGGTCAEEVDGKLTCGGDGDGDGDGGGGGLLFSDVSSEAVISELIGFGSVNLSLTNHHSPESTH